MSDPMKVFGASLLDEKTRLQVCSGLSRQYSD